jgi:hypothetical protein
MVEYEIKMRSKFLNLKNKFVFDRRVPFKVLTKSGNSFVHSRVGSWPHPQTLDLVEKACQGQKYTSLLRKSVNYGRKKFYSTVPSLTLTLMVLRRWELKNPSVSFMTETNK